MRITSVLDIRFVVILDGGLGTVERPKPPLRADFGSDFTKRRRGVEARSKMNCATRCWEVMVTGWLEVFFIKTTTSPL